MESASREGETHERLQELAGILEARLEALEDEEAREYFQYKRDCYEAAERIFAELGDKKAVNVVTLIGRIASNQGPPAEEKTIDPGRDFLDKLQTAKRLAEGGDISGIIDLVRPFHRIEETQEEGIEWVENRLKEAGSERGEDRYLSWIRLTRKIRGKQVPALTILGDEESGRVNIYYDQSLSQMTGLLAQLFVATSARALLLWSVREGGNRFLNSGSRFFVEDLKVPEIYKYVEKSRGLYRRMEEQDKVDEIKLRAVEEHEKVPQPSWSMLLEKLG